jgi:hypothetical protein
MKRALSLIAAATLCSAVTSSCYAQGPPPARYQPARPTISPYLNLYRFNAGPLPNYYSLVRPELNQLHFNQQQLAFQAQQTAALQGLQSAQAQQGQAATQTGKNSWFMTNGRATYMNTNRYFAGSAGSGSQAAGGSAPRAPSQPIGQRR